MEPFRIGGHTVVPGTRHTVDLPVSILSDRTPVSLSVHVVHGRRPGPTMFVSAAVHGDEIMGIEIVRRLLRTPYLLRLRGTLLAVPIVNAYGFIAQSRYLPDRRDLNRCFPGNAKGSLAAQLADLFMREVVRRSDLGIDLHSASRHRTNLPHIRICEPASGTGALAEAFGAPIILESAPRHGSLRTAASACEVPVLVYEAGEALRFDEPAIRVGTHGILRVMHRIGMLNGRHPAPPATPPLYTQNSYWIRAPEGGILRRMPALASLVGASAVVGTVADPFGAVETEIRSRSPGIVIGRTNLPLVNRGDAIAHVADVLPADPVGGDAVGAAEPVRQPLLDESETI